MIAIPITRLLDLVTSYAYDRRKYMTMSLEWGEGLPGTCAQEKETDLPYRCA